MTHTYRRCNIDPETLETVLLYAFIVTNICSFVWNFLVILTMYINKNLQTSTNYLIVSMSVSDILFPFSVLLYYMLLLGRVSQLSKRSKLVGNLLCKLLLFVREISYGVSMLTLVAITVYRFSAVMFPMRARLPNKRKRILVLLLTWLIPMAISSPYLIYNESVNEQFQRCIWKLNWKQTRIWIIAKLLLFHFLSLLIMLVLYPLIIIKLKQHRAPGNVINFQAVIRRKGHNYRMTMMFIVITVAFLLCLGPYIIYYLLVFVIEHNLD